MVALDDFGSHDSGTRPESRAAVLAVAGRRSKASASQVNPWHEAGVGSEDVIEGQLRSGCQAAW